MILATDVPDWVPDAIKSMVDRIELGEEIARRFLTDERMKTVWETLLSNKVEVIPAALDPPRPNDVMNQFPLMQRLRSELFPGIDSCEIRGTTSPGQQACVAFLCCATHELWRAQEAMRQQDLAAEVKRWRDAGDMCRVAADAPGRARLEPDLEKSLLVSSEYLKEYASFIERANKNTPYVFELKRDRGGDPDVRARTRALATHAQAIYGQYLYRTTAIVASVGLNTYVTEGMVRRWCEDRPR